MPITVKDTQGKEVQVPSMNLFYRTQRRFQIAYVIVSLATILGLYFFQKQSVNSEIDKINSYATASCLAQIKPTSTLNKYNDFVNSVIESRKTALIQDLADKDVARSTADREFIKRYQEDLLVIPNAQQCEMPILRK